MEQEKLYVIEEKTYEAHIDEEVHLYGLLHQLAFLAGKIKDREDVEAFIAAAKRYGQIAMISSTPGTFPAVTWCSATRRTLPG